MPRKLVSDELWSQIEPLLPKHKPTPKGGRPRIPDRAALTGIIFVLKTGIPWEDLPQEMGCGSGMTCWRRLRDWQEAGVWESLHHVILQNLHDTKKIDWSRACRFVNEVLQKGERVQDLFRRAPVERTHREIVICPFSYGELLFEVLKRIEAMQSVELFVVLAVTALHFTVVPWGIWPYHFVTDAQFL